MVKKISKFGIVLSLIGFLFTLYYHITFEEKYVSWKKTDGELESLYVQEFGSPAGTKSSRSESKLLHCKYYYFVDGKKIYGHRLTPLQSIYLEEWLVDSLKKGPITVYYDPSQSTDSFLFILFPTIQIVLLYSLFLFIFVLSLNLNKFINFFLNYVMKNTY